MRKAKQKQLIFDVINNSYEPLSTNEIYLRCK